MKWIYLHGNNQADALALASVIAKSSMEFGVVRKSLITPFLLGVKNVNVGFFPSESEEELIRIDCSQISRWDEKCLHIAQKLSVLLSEPIEPYLGFVQESKILEEKIHDSSIGVLLLHPHPDQNLDLMVVDKLTHLFKDQGLSFVSAGSMMMPGIKGTKDLRELVGVNELCGLRNKITLILTSEVECVSIAEALNIPAFLLSAVEGITVDGLPMSDANQIFNYMNIKLQNNNNYGK